MYARRHHEAAVLEGRRLAALRLQAAWGRVSGVLGGHRQEVLDAVQEALLGERGDVC